ncbi:MAG: iron ABC transporter permease [Chloroflexi bacterium]|nr:iron ABC transporter permease [Chloroflexota bacterium]
MATSSRPLTSSAPSIPIDKIVQWGIFILTLLLVIFPSWPIFYQSVMDAPLYEQTRKFTLDNFSHVLSDMEFWGVLGTTVVYALFTTIISLATGATLALLIIRTDMPARGYFSLLINIPFYVSPLILAFGWSVIFGPQGFFTIVIRNIGLPTWDLYTLGGLIAVSAMYYMPYTYLYCTASLSLSDSQLEDAARIAGANPLSVLFNVTLPLMRPALTYSALLTLVSSIEILSIPLVLGTPSNLNVLATYLYKIGIVGVKTDYGSIAVVSIFIVLLVTALVALQNILMSQEKRFVTVSGKATRPRQLRLGVWKWPIFTVTATAVFIIIVLPLFGILLQAITPFVSPFINPLTILTTENFDIIFRTEPYRLSVINSVMIAVIGGAVGVIFMAVVAVVAYRSSLSTRNALRYVALYPRAFPGLIVGIGFLWAFLLVPGFGSIRNTLFALTLAFIMRHLPLGFSSISPSVLRISEELDRAARVAGANWIGVIRHILIPILRPALLSAYIILAITFLKEYSVALFLFAPGSQVIGTTMIELWRQGSSGPIAALATIQMVIIFVLIAISRWVLGVKLNEVE